MYGSGADMNSHIESLHENITDEYVYIVSVQKVFGLAVLTYG